MNGRGWGAAHWFVGTRFVSTWCIVLAAALAAGGCEAPVETTDEPADTTTGGGEDAIVDATVADQASTGGCKSDDDCEADAPVCDTASGKCEGCTKDDQCDADRHCLDGKCPADVCKKGEKKCDGPGKVARCADNGGAFDPTPCGDKEICEDGNCLKVVCKADSKKCEDNGVATCNKLGTAWGEATKCSDTQTCAAGVCQDHDCKPASTKCENASILTCQEDGLGWKTTACKDGSDGGAAQWCADVEGTPTCQDQTCQPTQTACKDGIAVVCKDDGLGTTVVEDCTKKDPDGGPGKTCISGKCVSLNCVPKSTKCAGKNLVTCKDDGLGVTTKSCGAQMGCEDGKCMPIICLATSEFCDGKVAKKCNLFGTSATVTDDCPKADKTCSKGKCVEYVCKPGAISCGAGGGQVQTCNADGLSYKAKNCTGGTTCVKDTCKPVICTPDSMFCKGAEVKKCDATGTSSATDATCAKDKVCLQGKCVPKVCDAGELKCNGLKATQQCKPSGLGWTDKSCADKTACDKGQCLPQVCSPSALQCDEGKANKCDAKGLKWALAGDCKSKGQNCIAGKCVDYVCKAGAKKCDKGKLATCAKSGMSWSQATCGKDTICDAGSCEPLICTPKQKKCANNKAMVCNDLGTVSKLVSDCTKSKQNCVKGACVDFVCKAKTSKCEAGVRMICADDGMAWNNAACGKGTICEAGACKNVVCEAKKAFCKGHLVQQCNDLGTAAKDGDDCKAKGKACVAGKCVDLLCKPGALSCKSGKLRTCNADGLGWTAKDCAAGTACVSGVCKTVICKADQLACKGSVLQTCDATGTAIAKTVDCAADKKKCSAGKCVAAICKAGTTTCQSGQLATCDAGELSWNKQSCGVGKACDGGKCLAVICTPNKATCKVRQAYKCNATGTANPLLTDCKKLDKACVNGECKPLLCKPGAVKCDGIKLATCNLDGLTWKSADCAKGKACAGAKCVAVACKANEKSCDGFNAMLCNASGTKNELQAACDKQGKACKAGKCVPQVCKPGTKTCLQKDAMVCNADALGWKVTACGGDTVCENGVCAKKICTPFKPFCDAKANAIKMCNPLGTDGVTVTPCKSNELCIGTQCETKVCEPNKQGCKDLATLTVCNSTGTSAKEYPCGSGKVCYKGGCPNKLCEPSAKFCEKNVSIQCAATGLSKSTLADCSKTNQVCVKGKCLDKICKSGALSCIDGQVGTCNSDGMGWTKKPCDDGNACTSNGCKDAKCAYGAPKTCNDGNVCTTDKCDTSNGKCSNKAVGGNCDDGSKCTFGETCVSGVCKEGKWGVVSTLAGTGSSGVADGAANKATFNGPFGVTVGGDGTVYIAGLNGQRIRRIKDGTVSLWAGSSAGFANGKGSAAKFNNPSGIAVDAEGTGYVADQNNHKIRRIEGDGMVTVHAGGKAGFMDGAPEVAQFDHPVGVAVDKAGNVYVADRLNHRIRKINAMGVVNTLAGSGNAGNNDGPAAQARFRYPMGIAVDGAGNVYVGDEYYARVRKVAPNGTVSTLAGGSMGYKDGKGSAAQFAGQLGVAVNLYGQVAVADRKSQRIRLISPDGQVTTIAGTGSASFSDTVANQARFNQPTGVAFDHWGRIVIVDSGNRRIRLLTPSKLSCDDDNVCTKDQCDAKSGKCVFTALQAGTKCNDGSACTSEDKCSDKAQCVGKEKNCGDGNACTDDPCDAASGKCSHINSTAPCDDGNGCTAGDTCKGGKCVSGQPTVCDDKNSCTSDKCDTKAGKCVFTKAQVGAKCDDGDACTSGDACDSAPKCVGKTQKACDDSDLCTKDSCDPKSGNCVHTAIDLKCDDGKACTKDACDPKTGKCGFTNQTDGAACVDKSKVCTEKMTCKGGACQGGVPKACDDKNQCTVDSCDPKTGKCIHKPGGGCVPGRRVFLSSVKYTADLGGLSGADAKCKALADAQGLGGKWMAWLSDASTWPAKRFNKSNFPYVRIDGKLIANNWSDLVDQTIAAPINVDEAGKTHTGDNICNGKGPHVFTNTRPGGTRYQDYKLFHCSNWSYGGSSSEYNNTVHRGVAGESGNAWSNVCTWNRCNMKSHIYCFEQTDFLVPP